MEIKPVNWERNAEAIKRFFFVRVEHRPTADSRPIEERVSTLRYRLGIPKWNFEEFRDRCVSGEDPETVATELSAWDRITRRRKSKVDA